MKTLTDYEIEAAKPGLVNLADGHAGHNDEDVVEAVHRSLNEACDESLHLNRGKIEENFRSAFAILANAPSMADFPDFKVCPTASISIEFAGSLLRQRKLRTALLTPTFDNLALLLRRQAVEIQPVKETLLHSALEAGELSQFLDTSPCGALFLVQPNNPTGRLLSQQEFAQVAQYCSSRGIVLVVDNSFRLYNREPFDDYAVLREAGTSFIAFEDTGKAFATMELKASLLFCSPDLHEDVRTIYNELLLCASPLILSFLTARCKFISEFGLANTIWKALDTRRGIIREALSAADLNIEQVSVNSQLPVEWIVTPANMSDLDLSRAFASIGLQVLPGRNFFWDSVGEQENTRNVRLALMKPLSEIIKAAHLIQGKDWSLSLENPGRRPPSLTDSINAPAVRYG